MQELDKDQTEQVTGAFRLKIKWPPFPPIKKPPVTTLAVGEEGGGPIITTLALGEEGGGGVMTTMMVGEEGSGTGTEASADTSPLGTF